MKVSQIKCGNGIVQLVELGRASEEVLLVFPGYGQTAAFLGDEFTRENKDKYTVIIDLFWADERNAVQLSNMDWCNLFDSINDLVGTDSKLSVLVYSIGTRVGFSFIDKQERSFHQLYCIDPDLGRPRFFVRWTLKYPKLGRALLAIGKIGLYFLKLLSSDFKFYYRTLRNHEKRQLLMNRWANLMSLNPDKEEAIGKFSKTYLYRSQSALFSSLDTIDSNVELHTFETSHVKLFKKAIKLIFR